MDRWVEVTSSPFTHEAEGLAQVRDLLPDTSPFRAWSNVEFRDGQGRWAEVDLLVLGRRRLHLVELKYYSGVLRGNDLTWHREGHRPEDSPLKLARRKAQRLKSRLTEELFRLGQETGERIDPREVLPYVQESVYLHHPRFRSALPMASQQDLFGPAGAEHETGLPGIDTRLLESGLPDATITARQERIVVALLAKIGLVQRRKREVGSWVIDDAPLADGDGYQDWPAFHRVATTDRARIRFFLTPSGAAAEERTRVRRAAEHEYRIMSRLQHDGLLRPRDLVDDELGVGLVYPHDQRFRRLDLWLAERPEGRALAVQLAVLRQVAEALSYAHRHRIVHRGLVPGAVQVRELDDATVRTRVGDWQTAGVLDGTRLTGLGSTGLTGLGDGAQSRLAAIMGGRQAVDEDRRFAEAFQAPEGVWSADADRVRLDVFALGALAYYLVARRPPAADRAALRDRLARDHGLDLSADLSQVSSALRDLVLDATRPVVPERLPDVRSFLERLAEAERALAPSEDVLDPLEATPGAVLGGRFRLERRLGAGSTAVGLLVTDLAEPDDGRIPRVLKVAIDDAAALRLDDEAAVLAELDHPRLVRRLEGPLDVDGRRALLLTSAGDETLGEALRARPRLSLDLLERWGTDLLEALVGLDRAGVTHRDIKPANLGVLEGRGDRVKHLVLFDFSLARAAAGSLNAGTPPYLDPFLQAPGRGRYDSAAERYAAAVVLFEMATGSLPQYGDGATDPYVSGVEATVEPSLFDSAVAAGLVSFFRCALARDAGARQDTAGDMLSAWSAVFAAVRRAPHADADALADAAQPSTLLADAGFSARALSAVEPLGVRTAGDLAALDPGRLTVLRGVADSTRREVLGRARAWRERFAAVAAPRTDDGGAVAAGAMAQALVTRAGTPARRAVVRLLLGFDGDVDPFATVSQLATALGGKRPTVGKHIEAAQRAWADDPACRAHLDLVESAARQALADLGGVATVAELADAVRSALTTQAGDSSGPPLRVAAGLLAIALERDLSGDAAPVQLRRGRDGRVRLLATESTLLDAAEALAPRVDRLVREAADDLLLPMARAAGSLRAAAPGAAGLEDERIVRLAVAFAELAVISGSGELHSPDLPAATAVRLALGGLAATQPVTAQEIRSRVRARFPTLAPLPDRPRLDELLDAAELPLVYDDALRAYRSRQAPADTTGLASRQVTVVGGTTAVEQDIRGHVGQRLSESISARSFLALGVDAAQVDRAAQLLCSRHSALALDVTELLITAMRDLAAEVGLPWEQVLAADAAAPGSREDQGLSTLVRRVLPRLDERLEALQADAPEGGRPVVLLDLAPLARYGHLPALARWSDLAGRRRQAVWVLVPQLASAQGPLIDGRPLPLAAPGQFLRLDSAWLAHEPTREGAPA